MYFQPNNFHNMKSVQIQSFSGPYFPVFAYLDTFHEVLSNLLASDLPVNNFIISNISEDRLPLDRARKFNVHKPIIRHQLGVLNVFCTFNLHPVSRGQFQLFAETTIITKQKSFREFVF